MKQKNKAITIFILLIGLALIAIWGAHHNIFAGITGTLIIAYLMGFASLALSLISWLLGLLSILHSFIISLPVISTIHSIIMPAITPALVPAQALLSKIGPFKWAFEKIRHHKTVKMARCLKCSRETPANGIYCCQCGVKVRSGKNVSHKKGGS